MRSLIFFCGLMALNGLFAQRPTLGRLEKTYEKFKAATYPNTIKQTISTSNGKAIAVGETDAKTSGGTDAYVVIFNPMGQEILEKRIGGGKNDGFNAVVQLPDGTFLAAGYTNSKDKTQRGWLVHLSDSGKILHELTETCENFQTIAVGEDGAACVFSGLTLKVDLPKGLTGVGNTIFSLSPIPAGKNAVVEVKYRGTILTELGAEKPKMTCLLANQGILTDAVPIDIDPLSKPNNLTAALLMWVSPIEDETDIQNISVSKPKFDIKIKAIINEPVTREQFKLFVNEITIDGAKMDNVDLSSSSEQQQYRPIYATRLDLEPQKRYHIRVDLQTSKGEVVSSRTLIVKYAPEQPNLHVVSIGTSNPDLKYTAKDAANVANFFKSQTNLPFKKVHVEERSDSAQTDFKNIKRTIKNLVKRYEIPDHEKRIEEKDYLIVFVSSHGKTGADKQYKLLPSDYNAADGDGFTIDYQADVMNQLDKIKCHKIVLIDACHSGSMSNGAKNSRENEALHRISKAAVGITVIASCKADELSYEDDAWQNGAFTKALLEAFGNQICSDEIGAFMSDSDGDNLITLGEIMEFIKRRVPKIVAAQKRLTGQTPVVINNSLDSSIPLFVIPK